MIPNNCKLVLVNLLVIQFQPEIRAEKNVRKYFIRNQLNFLLHFGLQEVSFTYQNYLVLTWYRLRILLTQPWDTLSCLEMTQGRTPAAAISTIFSLIWLGKGLPFINTPPNWLTRPWPETNKQYWRKVNYEVWIRS